MLPGQLVATRRSLVLLWAVGLAAAWLACAAGLSSGRARFGLFVATVVATGAALAAALRGRQTLALDDPSRRAWTAIALGLALRLLAELRLGTLYLGPPPWPFDQGSLHALYVRGLRYLYVAADLAFLAAFIVALRGLQAAGLEFRMRVRDLVVVALLMPLPLVVYTLQTTSAPSAVEPEIMTFRLIGAGVGAGVTALCVALASATLQMGGGAWPWIWGAAAVAGITRGLAFVAAAAASSLAYGLVLEQSLLWTFACAWLLAAALHLRLLGSSRVGARS